MKVDIAISFFSEPNFMHDVHENPFKKLRVIVADDHTLFRKGLSSALEENPNVNGVVQAKNGFEVLDLLNAAKYDLLFLDITMPLMDGRETLKQIKNRGDKVKVVVVSMYDDPANFLTMYKLGISGYILKHTSYEDTIRAIDLILEDREYFSPEVADLLSYSFVSDKLKHTYNNNKVTDISDKEKEVLLLICEQLSVCEIAGKMGMSAASVKRYKHLLMEKTGAVNQVGLALYAVQYNIKKS